ncbi:hypothetical protein [Campylobacter hominis]|uniref:Uncharacterized protein n=1 Tax=Campylobacter hominis (strain ATCC BAA-381 / DSM 21671 / CCUG 45161 / LMG 19568 / NCTC 13146 / CH001A) TaxID=360107 RepID=A7I3I6_CAMHC|nr:hypothetical protein [Campylobacter hominis]ABS51008.1 conserved hypothetical protein [Campylobacter hominis ATCC BAA-381]UAK85708.1 hypothetical protein K8O82_07680 [Campylobacter hominis]SUW85591.1 Uncharacterised protein [Campylobacter hominis]
MIFLLYLALALFFLTIGLNVLMAALQLAMYIIIYSLFAIFFIVTALPIVIYGILLYFKELGKFTIKLITLKFLKNKKNEISNISE